MSYINTVNTYSIRNRFDYEHKKLYKKVKAIMQKQGIERDESLKNFIKRDYVKQAEKYEPLRKQALQNIRALGTDATEEQENAVRERANAFVFFKQYLNIISAMATDIDPNFKASFMFGFKKNEVKNFMSAHLSTYSRYDESKFDLKHPDWQMELEGIETARYDSDRNRVRNYEEEEDHYKDEIKNVYMHKEIIKEILNEKGFFWKLIHRGDVQKMNNYIRRAEETLREVNFTFNGEQEAKAEFAQSASLEYEYEQIYDEVEQEFEEQIVENQQSSAERESIEIHIDENSNQEISPITTEAALEKDKENLTL